MWYRETCTNPPRVPPQRISALKPRMTTIIEQELVSLSSPLDMPTTQSKALLSSADPQPMTHSRRTHMGYLVVLLEPTENLGVL